MRQVFSVLCLASFAMGMVAVAQTAHAGEPTAAEVAVARRLFAEAAALEEKGKWVEAAQKLREAIAIKETPGLRYHLAYSQEKLGLLVEALVDYDRAVELIERGAEAPDVIKLVGPARDRVREQTPTLTIVLPKDVADAELTIDGRPVARTVLEKPIPLNPGKHEVSVTASGRQPFRAEVKLAAADRHTLKADLRPRTTTQSGPPAAAAPATAKAPPEPIAASTPEAASAATDSDADGNDTARTVVLVSEVAITLGALATGIGAAVSKSAADDRVINAQREVDTASQTRESGCADSVVPRPTACQDLEDALDDAARARALSTIGFVVAGAGAVATVVTFLVWPTSEQAQNQGGALSVAGGVARDGGFLAVTSRF